MDAKVSLCIIIHRVLAEATLLKRISMGRRRFRSQKVIALDSPLDCICPHQLSLVGFCSEPLILSPTYLQATVGLCFMICSRAPDRPAGIISVNVALMACKADVKYDDRVLNPERIAHFLREIGFGAQPLDTSASPDESRCVLQVRRPPSLQILNSGVKRTRRLKYEYSTRAVFGQ